MRKGTEAVIWMIGMYRQLNELIDEQGKKWDKALEEKRYDEAKILAQELHHTMKIERDLDKKIEQFMFSFVEEPSRIEEIAKAINPRLRSEKSRLNKYMDFFNETFNNYPQMSSLMTTVKELVWSIRLVTEKNKIEGVMPTDYTFNKESALGMSYSLTNFLHIKQIAHESVTHLTSYIKSYRDPDTSKKDLKTYRKLIDLANLDCHNFLITLGRHGEYLENNPDEWGAIERKYKTEVVYSDKKELKEEVTEKLRTEYRTLCADYNFQLTQLAKGFKEVKERFPRSYSLFPRKIKVLDDWRTKSKGKGLLSDHKALEELCEFLDGTSESEEEDDEVYTPTEIGDENSKSYT